MSGKVQNNHSYGSEESMVKNKPLQKPETHKGFLNPVDRISETLYGVIMALTFTCTMKIAIADSMLDLPFEGNIFTLSTQHSPAPFAFSLHDRCSGPSKHKFLQPEVHFQTCHPIRQRDLNC
jgi:hypothetical protein